MLKKRKQFSAEDKISALREHLVEQIPISGVCDKHGCLSARGIHETNF